MSKEIFKNQFDLQRAFTRALKTDEWNGLPKDTIKDTDGLAYMLFNGDQWYISKDESLTSTLKIFDYQTRRLHADDSKHPSNSDRNEALRTYFRAVKSYINHARICAGRDGFNLVAYDMAHGLGEFTDDSRICNAALGDQIKSQEELDKFLSMVKVIKDPDSPKHTTIRKWYNLMTQAANEVKKYQ